MLKSPDIHIPGQGLLAPTPDNQIPKDGFFSCEDETLVKAFNKVRENPNYQAYKTFFGIVARRGDTSALNFEGQLLREFPSIAPQTPWEKLEILELKRDLYRNATVAAQSRAYHEPKQVAHLQDAKKYREEYDRLEKQANDLRLQIQQTA